MKESAIVEVVRARHLPPPVVRRARRLAAGLTQAELGEPLGVSGPCVSRWESGEREPRGELRERYAALLRTIEETVR